MSLLPAHSERLLHGEIVSEFVKSGDPGMQQDLSENVSDEILPIGTLVVCERKEGEFLAHISGVNSNHTYSVTFNDDSMVNNYVSRSWIKVVGDSIEGEILAIGTQVIYESAQSQINGLNPDGTYSVTYNNRRIDVARSLIRVVQQSERATLSVSEGFEYTILLF